MSSSSPLVIHGKELTFIQGAYFNRMTDPAVYEIAVYYKQSADSPIIPFSIRTINGDNAEKVREQLREHGITVSEWTVDATEEQETQWRKDNNIPSPQVLDQDSLLPVLYDQDSLLPVLYDHELKFTQGVYFNRTTNPESYNIAVYYKESADADAAVFRVSIGTTTANKAEQIREQLRENGTTVSEWNVDATEEQVTQWRKDNNIAWPRVLTTDEEKEEEEKRRVLTALSQVIDVNSFAHSTHHP